MRGNEGMLVMMSVVQAVQQQQSLTLPVVETEARQDRRGCHSRSRAPSFGPEPQPRCKLKAVEGAHQACMHSNRNLRTMTVTITNRQQASKQAN